MDNMAGKAGRPAMAEKDKKITTGVRVPPELREGLEDLVIRWDTKLSEVVRRLLLLGFSALSLQGDLRTQHLLRLWHDLEVEEKDRLIAIAGVLNTIQRNRFTHQGHIRSAPVDPYEGSMFHDIESYDDLPPASNLKPRKHR